MVNSNIIEQHYHGFRIGAMSPLSRMQLATLLETGGNHPCEPSSPLSGRSAVIRKKIDDIGPVIIKPYLRGGLMQYLLKDKYINTGSCRAKKEFNILRKTGRYGINVPEPVCYFQKGSIFYRCWLVTKEIPNKGSIASISMTDPTKAVSLMAEGWDQVERLVKKGIYHVDFHPGNVMAGKDTKIYILDFDKAFITEMEKKKLLKKYIVRWNRAVLKHKLPDRLLK